VYTLVCGSVIDGQKIEQTDLRKVFQFDEVHKQVKQKQESSIPKVIYATSFPWPSAELESPS
jgi:hypothetical protein